LVFDELFYLRFEKISRNKKGNKGQGQNDQKQGGEKGYQDVTHQILSIIADQRWGCPWPRWARISFTHHTEMSAEGAGHCGLLA
jgi:stalled ribosome alternative rescue factor ArfA